MRKLLLLMVFFANVLFAQDVLDIMKKVLNRDDGDNIISDMQMQLIDKNGDKRVRSMKTFSKDVKGATKKITFFTYPSSVKNTAFLTYDYDDENKDDDQWMYLPALKKIKRIPSSDKDSSFMGSDFSYVDMLKPILSDYKFKLLKEGVVKRKGSNEKVWIVEVLPKNNSVVEETGYIKKIVYIRKDVYAVTRAKYYLKNGNKVKYMDVKKSKIIDGVYFPIITTMVTKQGRATLHKTVLIRENIKVNQKIKTSYFTSRTLESGL